MLREQQTSVVCELKLRAAYHAPSSSARMPSTSPALLADIVKFMLELGGTGEPSREFIPLEGSVNVSAMAMEDDDGPLLGRLLRDARRRAGVSQRQLAIRTGIAPPSLSRIENGRESPSFERFATCMEALGFKPRVELHVLVGSRADPAHLAAEARLTPAQRLESLFEWMRFGDRLARAELRPLTPREG